MSRKLQLRRADIAGKIEKKYREEKDPKKRMRLLSVKLAAQGKYSAQEIAEICGCSRARVFDWLRAMREGGFEALLKREKPGPIEGKRRSLPMEVEKELEEGLTKGRWASAQQIRHWLREEHEIERPYKTIWNWLKKLGGVLRVARPSHPEQNKQAVEAFKNEVYARLEKLELSEPTSVKIWVMDEARFGLHTQTRRVWIKRGHRPLCKRQMRYEWDYLYGALEVVEGRAEFMHLPTVDLNCNELFLSHLASTDPEAVHVVIADQAGFHLRDGDPRLPAKVRILPLPPKSPELNPCEQLWDVLKDSIANQLHHSIDSLRLALRPALRRFWQDPSLVLSLIGRPWLHLEANSSFKI